MRCTQSDGRRTEHGDYDSETGLSGKYDFQFNLTDVQLGLRVEQNGIPAADSDGASVFTALQDQLGLKLRKAQIQAFVIDRVGRPSEN